MATNTQYQAFTALAANGSTAAMTFQASKHEVTTYFGAGVTFGSGTLTLEVSNDGGTTWVSSGVTWTSATANKKATVTTVYGTAIRYTLSGATNPTLNVAAKVERLAYNFPKHFEFTADGDSASFVIPVDQADMAFFVTGTWGSGTMTLNASPNGGVTWFAYDSATANAYKVQSGMTDLLFKFTLSGSTNPALRVDVFE